MARYSDPLKETPEHKIPEALEIEAIYESAPLGFCVFDDQLRFVRVNQKLAEINGVPVELHIGRTPREVVPDLAEQAEAVQKKIMETSEPVYNLEFTGTTASEPNVKHTWVEQWLPLKDEKGKIVGISVIAEEVTRRKQAEEALRKSKNELEDRVRERTSELLSANQALEKEIKERKRVEEALRASEEKYRSLVEQIPAIIYTASLKDFSTSYVNPQIQDYLGYTQEEWLAHSDFWWKRIHPDDISRVEREFDQARATAGRFVSEYRMLDRDGNVKWFRDESVIPREGSDVYQGFMFDITLRKEMEENLNRQREILQSTFDNIPVMLCFYDPEGRVSWVNPEMERLIGYSFKEFQEMDVMETCYPDPEYRKQVWDYMMKAEMGWKDFKVRTRSGTDLESSWSNVRLSDGSQIGIGIDITKRKQAEKKLRHLSKRILEAQETERKNVAHELHDGIGGNLLAIKMAVDQKLRQMQSGDTTSKGTSLEEIQEMVKSCVNDVRRVQHNLRPSVLDDLGLASALKTLCREFESAHGGICIACTLEVNEVSVPESLKIIIYRISQESLTNTVKHSGAENVSLFLNQNGGEIRLMIRDDGCGFDPEEVFSPRNIREGIGVDSMRERCELSGGTFSVNSQEGEGTAVCASWICNELQSPLDKNRG